MIFNILITIAVAILFVIVLAHKYTSHARHEYSKSLQDQLDHLRNRHDLLEGDSKRLATAFAEVQRTHLGLPLERIFKSNIH